MCSIPTSGSPWASPTRSGSHRIKLLQPYQVNAAAMANAKPTRHLHALPALLSMTLNTTIGAQDRMRSTASTEMEVTDQVFESKQSVVFDEAENRMHTIKAVIYATLC